jgi:hypothetical protein
MLYISPADHLADQVLVSAGMDPGHDAQGAWMVSAGPEPGHVHVPRVPGWMVSDEDS